MERTPAVLLLVVLLSLEGATLRDMPGLCHIWTPDGRHYVAGFSCPEANGPDHAVFCCGTCSSPRCCSSEVDRLDQERCYAERLPLTPPPVLLPRRITVGDTPGVCRVWERDGRQHMAVFSCPQWNDPPDAVLCCGTCSSPRCCTSEKNRLDQRRCQSELLPTTPPPVLLPQTWYFLLFAMGTTAFVVLFVCANCFSIQIWRCLRRTFRCLRRSCCCCRPPRQEVQMMVPMGALPTPCNMDKCPLNTYVSVPTVSASAKRSEGAGVASPAVDSTPGRGRPRSSGIHDNNAFVLSLMALQNASVCYPIMEAAVEMEDSSGSCL